MLRLARILKSRMTPQSVELARSMGDWTAELQGRVSREALGLLPTARDDGDYVNFMTAREGEAAAAQGQLPPGPASALRAQSAELLNFLNGQEPLRNSALESQRQYLAQMIGRASHVYLFETQVPVLLPYETADEAAEAARARAAAAPAPAPAGKKRGCLLPLLLLALLLLGLLFALWWFLLRPWPMEGTLADALDRLKAPFSHDYTQQLSKLDEIGSRADALLKKIDDQEEADRIAAEKKRQEELDALKDQGAKNEDEIKELQQRLDEAEKAREAAAAAAAHQQAKPEPKTEAKPEPKKPEAKPEPKKEDAPKPAAAKPASGTASLPKCKVLKQEGTMPKMVIAFDGSRSMLTPDVMGARNRLDAATSAASALVSSIDKNVDIGFVEINGCPVAKSRGFFTGIQRQALQQTIMGVNPMRYDGMTPLVNGLQKIAEMTDGVNADAVGVLISDGEDTCPV
ncbi:MAG: hypothetical protein ACI4NA_01975, partial [Succinivibrio sp.]